MPSLSIRTLVLCSMLGVLALPGCDVFLTEPAATGASVEVTLDPSSAGLSGIGGAQARWGTRELWLRLATAASSRDTVVPGSLGEGAFRARIWLHPDELGGPLEVQAQLRLPQGLALFGGTTTLENLGLGAEVTVELTPLPIIVSIDPSEIHLGISAFDGAFHTEFSADGEWIYFTGVSATGTLAYRRVLWKVRPDGADAAVVLSPAGPLASADRPAPSHDGRRLAFGGGGNLVFLRSGLIGG